ncbi:MAG TPA: hypothetical protein VLV49_16570 [Terriglobales bacterium]|nr:hypothetical protein [Terriglobales bacterium]
MRSLIKVGGTEFRIEGGLVRMGRLEADSYQFLEDPPAMLAALRQCGSRIDLFHFMQKLPDTEPKYSYPMEWDNLAALPVSTFEQWWTKTLGFKARNKAKQAEKRGVSIREAAFNDELVQGIWEVYNESPVRQGGPNTHYGKDVQTVYREEATFLDSSIFIGAYFEGKLIGFIKMVQNETRTQAGLMNVVSMVKHRDKAPTNALVAHAVRICAERKIPYLVYSRFAYGKKKTSSLTEFKERNGFQQVNLPRYYVPFTPLGWAAFHLGLHHRLAEYIPESLASRLRGLRSAWYNRKFPTMAESL